MGDRCTGACCESFVIHGIGRTPEDIDAFLRTRAVDGKQIADMVIPLRRIESGAVMPDGTTATEEPDGGGWVFTCRHFDTLSRNCGIYELRPAMCRDFPYGKPCEHGERCGWTRGRDGRWPPPRVHYSQWVPAQADPGVGRQRTHLIVLGDAQHTRAVGAGT